MNKFKIYKILFQRQVPLPLPCYDFISINHNPLVVCIYYSNIKFYIINIDSHREP